MTKGLLEIFEGISPPSEGVSDNPVYAVVAVPRYSSYFVGKDMKSRACLLVLARHELGGMYPPIRLENLDAQFELRCHLKEASKPVQEGNFSVVRCRDTDGEMTRYFLSVCETLLHVLGDEPTKSQLTTAVIRLAAIFQRVRQPPARPLSGLFGELYLMLRSGNAIGVLRAWHPDANARFDFSKGDVRLEVKATGGRNRVHTFSYDQCNPPSGTIAVVASLFAEQTAGGTSLRSVISQLETRVSADADLVLKLHETVAATLGTRLTDGLSRRFDMRVAEWSLRFFAIEDVPAIRGPLPVGVSEVHFRSDLSSLAPVPIEALVDRDPLFWDFLPSGD